jgi:putative sterol carrier protein
MSMVKEIFEQMPRRFMRQRAAGLDAVIQYDVKGEGGGTWHVVIKDGSCRVLEGPAPEPTLRLQIAADDWLLLIMGRQSPQALFMAGKLKMNGDVNLALRLPAIFRTGGARPAV